MKIFFTIEFIDNTNQSQYKQQTLDWLKRDFESQRRPDQHFWHNRQTIAEAFERGKAMVALTKWNKVIGYMIWRDKNGGAEIEIIEVNKKFRQNGICKQMIKAFTDRFPDIAVLTAMVLPQSEAIFSKMGWEKVYETYYKSTKYFKIIRPVLQPVDALPDGRVIAVCAEDCYKVKANPSAYQHLIHYFPIEVDIHGNLRERIVTHFSHEGYVGIYFNKELIVDGKARHILDSSAYEDSFSVVLIINKIIPQEPDLFYKKEFLPQSPPTSTTRKRLPPSTSALALEATTETAQQAEKRPTFFQPAKPALQIEDAEPPQITPPKP